MALTTAELPPVVSSKTIELDARMNGNILELTSADLNVDTYYVYSGSSTIYTIRAITIPTVPSYPIRIIPTAPTALVIETSTTGLGSNNILDNLVNGGIYLMGANADYYEIVRNDTEWMSTNYSINPTIGIDLNGSLTAGELTLPVEAAGATTILCTGTFGGTYTISKINTYYNPKFPIKLIADNTLTVNITYTAAASVSLNEIAGDVASDVLTVSNFAQNYVTLQRIEGPSWQKVASITYI